jgi:hypothetical protein
MDQLQHDRLIHTNDRAFLNCASRGHAYQLTSQATLAEETTVRQDGYDSFLATL